jgi:hypothetical protein
MTVSRFLTARLAQVGDGPFRLNLTPCRVESRYL